MIELLDPRNVPSTVKTINNWKFVQVSGRDKVCVCEYDNNDDRISNTSAVVAAFRSDKRSGVLVKTESGTIYFLKDSEQHASPWKLGINIKRPAVYARLQELRVI